MDRIPDSMLAHILSFVSCSDLVRYQVVQKRWRYIILSHHFAQQHLQNFLPNTLETELFVTQREQGENWQCVLRSAATLTQTTGILDILGSPIELGTWQCHQSTDGIILLIQYNGELAASPLMLWNPSIHKTLLLPDLPILPELDIQAMDEVPLGIVYVEAECSYRVMKLMFNEKWLLYIALYTLNTQEWTMRDYIGIPLAWRWELLINPGTAYKKHLVCPYYNDMLNVLHLLVCDGDTASILLLPFPPDRSDASYEMQEFTVIVLDGGRTLGITDFESGMWTFDPPEAPLHQRSWQPRYAFALTPSRAPHVTLHNEIVLQPRNTRLVCSLPVNGTLIQHMEIGRRYMLDAGRVYNIILPTEAYREFRSIFAHFNNLALLSNVSTRTKLPSSYLYQNPYIQYLEYMTDSE